MKNSMTIKNFFFLFSSLLEPSTTKDRLMSAELWLRAQGSINSFLILTLEMKKLSHCGKQYGISSKN